MKRPLTPATVAVWKQVVANLKEYMPEGIRINQFTAGHAKEFHEKLKARGMATTTIHKRIQFARQFMHDAVDWKIIDENPFSKVRTQRSTVKVNEFVPREVVDKLMKKANPVWQVILGLSRYGGLRTPSETLSLRWEDIDWEMNRMSIPEPKVEHHEGRGIRSCPIFPELRPILDEAFEIFGDKSEYVVAAPQYRAAANTAMGWKKSNLQTEMTRLLRRAGVSGWPRLFHSMRASRQTELQRELPLHVVCSWLGNSPQIAQQSYLLVIGMFTAQLSFLGTEKRSFCFELDALESPWNHTNGACFRIVSATSFIRNRMTESSIAVCSVA
ncbi:MAG: tyrosine-type recombinase/integrase [Planctomycetota bacterium]